jgi:DNA-binding NtrC family response regulator
MTISAPNALFQIQTTDGSQQMTTNSRSLLYLKPPTVDDLISRAISQRGWTVHVVTQADAALQLISQQDFRVGLVHWDHSELDWLDISHEAELLLDADSSIKWVALLSNVSNLSRIITTYFYDFHTLPVDTERLLITLGHAYGMAEITRAHTERHDYGPFQFKMGGEAPVMQSLFQKIRKVAAIDLTVMIRGESGTGKELAAHAIHRESKRANDPFVVINCGALPKELVQAELFGHEKGAFTGADCRRVGRIEAANKGTLFLDEIGDLPLGLQANLLRFLQEKTIDRIGGSGQIPVDVRVLAATHVHLEKAVEKGQFREDLYYRLSVLNLEVPPLRERGPDVELLARHFCRLFAIDINPNVKGFSQQAIDAINAYSWPGNVREMINRIQRAIVMCEGKTIKLRDLGLDQDDTPIRTVMTLADAREKAEKEAIERALRAARNNVSKAAKYLNISRVTLYRLMEIHSIDWQKK